MAHDMGAIGFKVTTLKELAAALDKVDDLIAAGNRQPIVIDAKIKNVDPIDTSFVPVDPNQFDDATIQDYRQRYDVSAAEQPALSTLLATFKDKNA